MTRLLPLDVLRAVAVFLVLGRHAFWPADCWWGELWQRGGWVGVDLFFVLSGFLVSGLLFSDLQKHGQIRWARFYFSRGFKIYPAFWFLILFMIVLRYGLHEPVPWIKVAGELLFLQNYWQYWLGHAWSLAVEEHFYLLLPILLMAQPPERLPRVVLMCGVALLVARCCRAFGPYSDMGCLTPTHLRLDSLFFGVLLSYWYRYCPFYKTFCHRHGPLLYGVGVLLLLPAFLFPLEMVGIWTVGFTVFYLGSGAILSAAVCFGMPENGLVRLLGWVGRHSYSIYLWHALVREAALRWLGLTPCTWSVGVYMALSILVGVGMAKLIEFPMLRLRDRWRSATWALPAPNSARCQPA